MDSLSTIRARRSHLPEVTPKVLAGEGAVWQEFHRRCKKHCEDGPPLDKRKVYLEIVPASAVGPAKAVLHLIAENTLDLLLEVPIDQRTNQALYNAFTREFPAFNAMTGPRPPPDLDRRILIQGCIARSSHIPAAYRGNAVDNGLHVLSRRVPDRGKLIELVKAVQEGRILDQHSKPIWEQRVGFAMTFCGVHQLPREVGELLTCGTVSQGRSAYEFVNSNLDWVALVVGGKRELGGGNGAPASLFPCVVSSQVHPLNSAGRHGIIGAYEHSSDHQDNQVVIPNCAIASRVIYLAAINSFAVSDGRPVTTAAHGAELERSCFEKQEHFLRSLLDLSGSSPTPNPAPIELELERLQRARRWHAVLQSIKPTAGPAEHR